jgi:hypothetical protein
MTTATVFGKQALAYAVAGAAALGSPAIVQADFSGPYDHANWTFTQVGDSSFTATLTTLTLTGPNDGDGTPNLDITTLYTIAADASGTVSFDWNYSSTDIGDYDNGGFTRNGVRTTLANNDTQSSGSFSTSVNAGDIIGFFVFSDDAAFGPGVLAITNFSGPVAVPEPGSLGLLALGTVGGVLGLRRRRRS